MLIPEDIRKCVAFIGTEVSGSNVVIGSVFFVGTVDGSGGLDTIYAVTAKHNIDAIRNSQRTKVMVRLNDLNGGNTWIRSNTSGWFSHPNDATIDVAVHHFNIPADYDHLVFPIGLFLTEAIIKENEIGLGDEVMISGLFKYHFGDKRNLPIVRTGNIAAFHEEKIPTKHFGSMDAHLIECRSISGLSGSPVFVNIGMIRRINNLPKIMTEKPPLYLLGLVHGHFDTKAIEIDNLENEQGKKEAVNTGMAIVVPCEKISEVISEYEKYSASKTTV